MHYRSLKTAYEALKEIRKTQKSIGSVHTLGALHEGHAQLIKKSASENEITIVTVYPNKIQLFPGSKYKYDLEKDVSFALESGANIIISTTDEEMFWDDYRTFITQGESHSRLNSSVFSFAARGQITGTIRWLNFTKPHRSYFGMKDIEQAILVERAAKDLFIDCEIIHVPCVRFKNGVSISSRLLNSDESILEELGRVYSLLQDARLMMLQGETNSSIIKGELKSHLLKDLNKFDLLYLDIVDVVDFAPKEEALLPVIIHLGVKYNELVHFDGLWLRDKQDLVSGPPVIWLE